MSRAKTLLVILCVLVGGALACNAPTDDQLARATDAAMAQGTLDARFDAANATPSPEPTATSVSGYPIINPENAATLTPVQRLLATDQPIDLIGWSGDGMLIAAAAKTNIGLIESDSWQQVRVIETENTFSQIALSPHGYLMATIPGSEGGEASLWDTQTGQPARSEISLQGATRVAWSPDGSRLAIARAGGMIDLIAMESGRRIQSYNPHDVADDIPPDMPAPVNDLWISPDGSTLAAIIQTPPYLLLWDVNSGDLISALNFGEDFDARDVRASVSPSWDRFVWIADNTIVLTEIESGENIEALTFDAPVGGFDWSPDGSLIAVATAITENGAVVSVVRLINSKTAADLGILRGEWVTPPTYLTFSPDGSMLAIPNGDGTVSIWSANQPLTP